MKLNYLSLTTVERHFRLQISNKKYLVLKLLLSWNFHSITGLFRFQKRGRPFCGFKMAAESPILTEVPSSLKQLSRLRITLVGNGISFLCVKSGFFLEFWRHVCINLKNVFRSNYFLDLLLYWLWFQARGPRLLRNRILTHHRQITNTLTQTTNKFRFVYSSNIWHSLGQPNELCYSQSIPRHAIV